MKNRRPKIGIGVIVMKDDKVLFGQRLNSHGANHWSFPGGHLEWYESFEECAIREVMEEVGITIKNIRFAHVTNDLMKFDNKHYITIFMIADYSDGKVTNREPDKYNGWFWYDWNDMPEPLFEPIVNLLADGYKI